MNYDVLQKNYSAIWQITPSNSNYFLQDQKYIDKQPALTNSSFQN